MIIEFDGFEDSIRNYICGVISASFQRLSLENLKEFVGVSSTQEAQAWIDRSGWSRDQGIVFVASQEDKVKVSKNIQKIFKNHNLFFQSKSIVERVNLSSLVPVMSLGARKLGK